MEHNFVHFYYSVTCWNSFWSILLQFCWCNFIGHYTVTKSGGLEAWKPRSLKSGGLECRYLFSKYDHDNNHLEYLKGMSYDTFSYRGNKIPVIYSEWIYTCIRAFVKNTVSLSHWDSDRQCRLILVNCCTTVWEITCEKVCNGENVTN